MATRRRRHSKHVHGRHHHVHHRARSHHRHSTHRRHVSAATKAKLRARLKGKHHKHKGHKLSAAARRKISARLKGRHHHRRAVRAHQKIPKPPKPARAHRRVHTPRRMGLSALARIEKRLNRIARRRPLVGRHI